MDRTWLAKQWNDAWTDGLWAAAWGKAVAGLTAAQAAWTPAPGRHSIWQILEHMSFWREDALRRLAGSAAPSKDQIAAGNFPAVRDPSEKAWRAAQARFEDTQKRIAAAIADPAKPLERIQFLLAHDSYHVGQVMYLRALQGLPPIE